MKKKRIILPFLLLLSAFSLASCEENPFGQDTQAATETFSGKVFPNGIWDFVIQLLAFVILLIFVFVIGYKPVKKMLDARKEAVTKMVEDAASNQEIARRAAEKADFTVEQGKKEAASIIEEAKRQAAMEKDGILKEAKAEVTALRKRADEDIEAAKEASKEEVRSEIVDVAMLASSQLLGREVRSKDNERLVADFIDDLKKGNEK